MKLSFIKLYFFYSYIIYISGNIIFSSETQLNNSITIFNEYNSLHKSDILFHTITHLINQEQSSNYSHNNDQISKSENIPYFIYCLICIAITFVFLIVYCIIFWIFYYRIPDNSKLFLQSALFKSSVLIILLSVINICKVIFYLPQMKIAFDYSYLIFSYCYKFFFISLILYISQGFEIVYFNDDHSYRPPLSYLSGFFIADYAIEFIILYTESYPQVMSIYILSIIKIIIVNILLGICAIYSSISLRSKLLRLIAYDIRTSPSILTLKSKQLMKMTTFSLVYCLIKAFIPLFEYFWFSYEENVLMIKKINDVLSDEIFSFILLLIFFPRRLPSDYCEEINLDIENDKMFVVYCYYLLSSFRDSYIDHNINHLNDYMVPIAILNPSMLDKGTIIKKEDMIRYISIGYLSDINKIE